MGGGGSVRRAPMFRVPRVLREWFQDNRVSLAVGVGVLVVLAVIVTVVSSLGKSTGYRWDFDVVERYLPALLEGLVLTLQITFTSITLGLLLGILVAIGRLSPLGLVRGLVTAYIELMRGTPQLVQLIWVYYTIPIVTGIQLPAFVAVVLAFTLNLGAFYGEAFRSGIQAVPREQVETADILGLSYSQKMRYVVIPQATRIVLPVLISLSISLFKDTSLVSTLGVADLMYQGRVIATATYRPLEILSVVAAIYFLIAFPVTLIMRRVEIHIGRHLAQTH